MCISRKGTRVKIAPGVPAFGQGREVVTAKTLTQDYQVSGAEKNIKDHHVKSKHGGYNFHSQEREKSSKKIFFIFTNQKRKKYI